MESIYDILNFRFDANNLGVLGEEVVRKSSKTVAVNTSKLRQVTRDIAYLEKAAVREQSDKRRAIISKINNRKSFSLIELRYVPYYIHNIELEGDDSYFILEQLMQCTSNSIIKGLVHFAVHCYDFEDPLYEPMLELLKEKLKAYDGSRPTILKYKECIQHFTRQGAFLLGRTLRTENHSIFQAPEYIGLGSHYFNAPFFAKVVLGYYHKNYHDTELLAQVLQRNSNTEFTKVLLSNFICGLEKYGTKSAQDTVRALALKHIGDPVLKDRWATSNVEEGQKEKVEKAQKILTHWLTFEFIDSFFEKCINDPKRRTFWLKYVEHIHNFKVIAAPDQVKVINEDQELSQMAKHKLKKADIGRFKCALALYINNYVIIEFSDVGAIHVYDLNDKDSGYYSTINQEKIKLLERGSLHAVGDLSETTLPNLVEDNWYYSNIGRLAHRGHWEGRLQKWFHQKCNIYVDI